MYVRLHIPFSGKRIGVIPLGTAAIRRHVRPVKKKHTSTTLVQHSVLGKLNLVTILHGIVIGRNHRPFGMVGVEGGAVVVIVQNNQLLGPTKARLGRPVADGEFEMAVVMGRQGDLDGHDIAGRIIIIIVGWSTRDVVIVTPSLDLTANAAAKGTAQVVVVETHVVVFDSHFVGQ
jgi:hypothetical protein